MTDASLHSDGRWIAAQRGANRDRRIPVIGVADPVGDWGDPRTAPFDPRPSLYGSAIKGLAVLLVGLSAVWALALVVI